MVRCRQKNKGCKERKRKERREKKRKRKKKEGGRRSEEKKSPAPRGGEDGTRKKERGRGSILCGEEHGPLYGLQQILFYFKFKLPTKKSQKEENKLN